MSDENQLNDASENTPAPPPAAAPTGAPNEDDEWVPKSLMISRLAEKERKHKREKDELLKQMENTMQDPQTNAIQAQAAQNVVQSMEPQPQQPPMQQMPQQQPAAPAVTPEMLQQVAQNAIQAHEEAKQQAELAARHKAEMQEYKAAQQEVLGHIDRAMKEDPELAEMVNQHRVRDPDSFMTNLVQHLSMEPNPAAVFKKVMSNPEHVAALQNSSTTKQGLLIRKLAAESHAENLKDLAPTPQTQFASRGGSPAQKSPENMNYEEFREYARSRR